MELIENPQLKSTYDKCKYRVKLWEYNFKKQHGRLPSKLDIHEAEKEVRFAYKTYFNLKLAAIERSFVDVEGFQLDEDEVFQSVNENKVEDTLKREQESDIADNIWGKHLNNKIKEGAKKKDVTKMNVNVSFSQKLFNASKFSKRNPRKSLSLQNRKSRCSQNDMTQNQTEEMTLQDDANISSSQEFFESFISQNCNNFKVVQAKSESQPQSLDLIQSVLNDDYKLRNTLDTGWIDRVMKKTGAENLTEYNKTNFNLPAKKIEGLVERSKSVNYDDDSDDVIGNSEDESLGNDVRHVPKKLKMDLSRSMSYPGVSNIQIRYDTKERNDSTSTCVKLDAAVLADDKSNKNIDTFECINSTLRASELNQKATAVEECDPVKKVGHSVKNEQSNAADTIKITKNKQRNVKQSKEKSVVKKRPSRAAKAVNLKDASDSEVADDQSIDVDYLQGKSELQSSEATKMNKNAKKSIAKRKGPNDEPQDTDQYELEYSVKPRIVTVPRIKSVRKKKKQNATVVIEESDEIKTRTKQDIAREKLEKKIATGGLNENFVTINIKKKVFVRGKKGITYSKYKKQQWRKKKKALSGPDMDMGGCDGGMLICFNCGDIGHFARQCPKRKGDQLLPLQTVEGEDVEECPFPTLEDAEKMAQESALAVRKSNKQRLTGQKTVDEEEEQRTEKTNEDDSEVIGDSQSGSDFDDDAENDELLLAETVKLEEFVAKLDVQAYIDSTTFVKPYYELNDDGTMIDTPKEVFQTLKKFGYNDFRPGQETAVMRILSGKSTLVTLSTGSGKSLCYQLPAYIYSKREPCIALVISPLVSLMEDQVSGLPPFLKAACLHTNQTKVQREKVMELVASGSLSILLVSPEAVAAGERSTGFGSLLRKLPPISFACIDEAHCVSQWSHNFRPSYLMICRILRERLGVNVILGLTATATVSTANNIVRHLEIPDGLKGIISDTPLPDNIRLTVSKDGNRDNALLGLLMSERFAQCRSVIVYCIRREECERVAAFLRMALKEQKRPTPEESGNSRKRKRVNVEAQPYHAGLSASKRKSIQKSFMSGELRIVVATVAFGMGINKSDIRSVIHYNMPSSFESYVQEIGRAGRDGLPAHCHLFLDSQGNDENELRRHIHANSIDHRVIRKLLERIFVPCSCLKDACPKHEVAFSIQETVQALDVPEENIATLFCYLELHDCRFVQVLSPAYVTCKVISYNGAMEIRKAAKDCPPLAMALALYADAQSMDNIFEFPVIDVASAMGWDSGICKHKLKNLEWTIVNGSSRRSSLRVEFSNLGFRLLAPGNLTETQLNDTLDYLYKRVVDQEKMCLMQLQALHTTLTSVAARTYNDCLSVEADDAESSLKDKIRQYFNSPDPLASCEEEPIKPVIEEAIIKDTRQLITMYKDNVFTGRAVARIFHGIQSPNYPAVIWGRCRFWRSHLKDDFYQICKIATGEILKMR